MNKTKKNLYEHSIDLKELKLLNSNPEQFRKELEKIPYRGYLVEHISDGRKIVIAKPGGKSVYGRPKKEDFLVWIYDPTESSFWQISHKQILTDLELKVEAYPSLVDDLVKLFERVCSGEEPDSVAIDSSLQSLPGESLEAVLKAYKWIWGQEDVNYPTGEGRELSMKGIRELKNGRN